jgi:hypothetical protein
MTRKLMATMNNEVKEHLAEVEASYRPLLVGSQSRIVGGSKLWERFANAVRAYGRGKSAVIPVIERINEMAVARIALAEPKWFGSQIEYEPAIPTVNGRIDLVIQSENGHCIYWEIKTVHPNNADSDDNWEKTKARQRLHPKNVYYDVRRAWMGATIYGNAFSARSSFMSYTLEYEAKLADAIKVKPGSGVLIFCGVGFHWELDKLEDFSYFYHTGVHRIDDPFAKMESFEMTQRRTQLMRNLAGFGFMQRPHDRIAEQRWVADVR